MKILITGTTGYLGHKLALEAARRGYQVHALVRNLSSPFLPKHPSIKFFQGNILDKAQVMRAISKCNYVFHTAGITKFISKNRSEIYLANVTGTRNMLEAAMAAGVEKFVYTSSGATAGPSGRHPHRESDPRIRSFENDYELSKHAAEKLVAKAAGKNFLAVSVCPTRIFGPGPAAVGNHLTPYIVRTIRSGIALVPISMKIISNYVFIDDVVEGHFLAMHHGKPGEKYFLGGQNLSYSRFISEIEEETGKKLFVIKVPYWLLYGYGFVNECLARLWGNDTQVNRALVKRFSVNRAINSGKAISELGYHITPFRTAIAKTLNRENHEAGILCTDHGR